LGALKSLPRLYAGFIPVPLVIFKTSIPEWPIPIFPSLSVDITSKTYESGVSSKLGSLSSSHT
jgi:hypothetical protein